MGANFLFSKGHLYVNAPARRGDICWREKCWSRSRERVVEQWRTWRPASAVLGGTPRTTACSPPPRSMVIHAAPRPREHRAAPRRDGGARADIPAMTDLEAATRHHIRNPILAHGPKFFFHN